MHSTGPFFLPARSREEAIPDTNLSQVSKETWPEWHQTDRGLPGYPPALHLEDYGEHNKFVVATYFEGIFEEGKLVIYQTRAQDLSGPVRNEHGCLVGDPIIFERNTDDVEQARRNHAEVFAAMQAYMAGKNKRPPEERERRP
jgi:hypothetical protein